MSSWVELWVLPGLALLFSLVRFFGREVVIALLELAALLFFIGFLFWMVL